MSLNARLSRLSLTVTTRESASDPALVPAFASVDVYKQGATVTSPVTIADGDADVTITVRDIGRIQPGDHLCKNTATGTTVLVEGTPDRNTIVVASDFNGDLVLATDDRLVVTTVRPTVYKLSTGSIGGETYPGSQVWTNGNTGHLPPAYLTERFVDLIVTVPSTSIELLIDQPTGQQYPVLNALDMGGDGDAIQTAIDALPDNGGTVLIPSGTYLLRKGLVINKDSVTLQGEGHSTYLKAVPSNSGPFTDNLLTVNGAHCKLSKFLLDGAQASGSGSGIVFNGLGVSGVSVKNCVLENLQVQAMPNYGLWLRDTFEMLIVNCEFISNRGTGVRVEKVASGVNGNRFVNCEISSNQGQGAVVTGGVGITFYSCDFELNMAGWEVSKAVGVEADSCERIELLSCYFENAATGPDTTHRAEQFVLLHGCKGSVVDSCFFQGDDDGGNTLQPYRAVRFDGSRWSRLSNCVAVKIQVALAFFSSDSNECIEFGNRELTAAELPRFTMADANVRVIGMSRAALGLPTHIVDGTRPSGSDVRSGSLIWYTDPITGLATLQARDGVAWKSYRSPAVWVDVRDFGNNIQAAINSLPAGGGGVFVPKGTYTISAGLTVSSDGVTLVGDGPGTLIRAQTANSFDLLTITASRCRLYNLQFDGAATTLGSKNGIVVKRPVSNAVRRQLRWDTDGLNLRDTHAVQERQDTLFGFDQQAAVDAHPSPQRLPFQLLAG